MGQGDHNNQSVRVFVAVPIPKPIAEELEHWRNANRDKLPFRKWTHPQDYHITLQFLGETSLHKLEAICTSLREIKANPFTLSINGGGFFGQAKSPRVLWSAVSGDIRSLRSLHLSVIQATSGLGFIPEERPYNPHITLARKATDSDSTIVEVMSSAPAGLAWEVDHFTLMRTHMNVSPMYEIVETFTLM
ncbi:RNA 2',3'-cyclic phosphodiesterase [Paenibacillus segetis]|uniref:RNA 2',3'-cyclic phosphodiesterase n=1 Tax=Paenibacillus segetis TaxID=1325360 RepID=A0ABQ1Y8C3_9BACL|nr:RNA 2',3'-cyclic phosphodiesterase [Paenibacillus segetis]GGH15241.1 RNA 2',3'-cyclic phosphodiesterase [Paenibacillus segetis]